ncbi:MAG TPA: hypothetical protein VFT45_06540 [Longimicrobium sp.]|nr:hypothetical protein [Longimicrobium sp.]
MTRLRFPPSVACNKSAMNLKCGMGPSAFFERRLRIGKRDLSEQEQEIHTT